MSSSTLNAVPVVDATLASFCIYIKPLEVVVKVDRASTEVSSEEGGVCREDCGDIDAALLGEGKSNASKPLVEVGNDRLGLLVAHELN